MKNSSLRRAVVALMALLVVAGVSTATAQRGPERSRSSKVAHAAARGLRESPALRTADRRARAHAAWRKSAGARRARLRSRSAYAHAGRVEIGHLLQRKLGAFLGSNDQVVSPDEVRRYTGTYTAVLDNRKLAVSSVPLRSPETNQPVDLTLRSDGGGLQPTAPLAGYKLPGKLGDGVELPG